MPEDIIDFQPMTAVEPAAADASPETPAAKPDPSHVTRDDMAAFGQSLAKEIVASIQTHTVPADWERQFAEQTAATATARMMEANKPLFAASLAEQVAGQYGPEVKREVVEMLQRLPGHIVAGLPHSAEDMKRLGHIARGMHAERQAAQAPRSSGAGTVNAASVAENEMAAKFWNDYKDVPGFTKEMAREMAKDAAG